MRQYVFCIFLVTASACSSKFDKDVWLKNQNSKSDNPRFDMVDDLVKNYLERGMERKEIVQLLGLPTYDTAEYVFEYSYQIGSNSGFNIDPYFLVIEFDSKGQMIDSRVEEH